MSIVYLCNICIIYLCIYLCIHEKYQLNFEKKKFNTLHPSAGKIQRNLFDALSKNFCSNPKTLKLE